MDKRPTYDELRKQLQRKETELAALRISFDKLQVKNQQYQEMLDLFPISFYEVDLNTRKFTESNAVFASHTGYSRTELLKLEPHNLMTEKSQQDFNERVRRYNENGALNPIHEYEILTKNDRHKWLLVHSSLVKKNGQPAAIRCMAIDITDRKVIEQNLRDSEERFRRLAELLPETIFETDENGILNFVNKNAFLYFYYNIEDFRSGLNIFDMVAPVDRDRAIKNFNRIYAGEDVGIKEYQLIRKDSSTFPGMVLATGLYKNKKVCGLRGFVVDLTDKKRLEAQLTQSQKMESIGTMAGGIAHDFNNILGAIIGYSELLEFFRNLDEEEIESYLKKVLEASYRAKELVKQILMFSRQTEPEKKPIRMVPIVRESLKLLRASLPSSIEIKRKFKKINDTIYADATQIHQIVMNLGANAGHAMRDRPGVLEVEITQEDIDDTDTELLVNLKPGTHLKLSVRDNGHGMPPDIMHRVFEPYFTTKEKEEGTGLGLSVVHGIISKHDGAITVTSQQGRGTEFNLYFPVISNLEQEIKRDVPKVIPKGNERVLLVDDEKPLVKLGNDMLKYLGYKVTAVTSSLEALNIFNASPDQFDLVITDQTMPLMSGSELAKAILMIRPDIPIILCTGYSETFTETQAADIGIKAFMMKPIVLNQLADIIRNTLDAALLEKKE